MRAEVEMGMYHCLGPGEQVAANRRAISAEPRVLLNDVIPMLVGLVKNALNTLRNLSLLHYKQKMTIKNWYLINIKSRKIAAAAA